MAVAYVHMCCDPLAKLQSFLFPLEFVKDAVLSIRGGVVCGVCDERLFCIAKYKKMALIVSAEIDNVVARIAS